MQLGTANRHNTHAPGPHSAIDPALDPVLDPALDSALDAALDPALDPALDSALDSALCTPYPLPTYNLNCRMMTKRAKIRAQPAKVTVVVS